MVGEVGEIWARDWEFGYILPNDDDDDEDDDDDDEDAC